jgi:hypothetical protein
VTQETTDHRHRKGEGSVQRTGNVGCTLVDHECIPMEGLKPKILAEGRTPMGKKRPITPLSRSKTAIRPRNPLSKARRG